MTDYYEFLQISPNADADTIHRVYRFLAARFHPDNQMSGDVAKFNQLKVAYDILSDSNKRAEYDALRRQYPQQPLSESIDFMDNLEGELNRRVAVLAMLYYRRRTNPNMPEVSLHELEERMGFPRDYLDFTLWYLQRKGYITKTDDAQYALTADGVDFVETERAKMPTLNRLLTTGTELSAEQTAYNDQMADHFELDSHSSARRCDGDTAEDRRSGDGNRRTGAADSGTVSGEGRGSAKDRRHPFNDRSRIN